MMVSTRGRYALQVIVDLAENSNGNYIPMKEVANRQGVSLKYLERILPLLTKGDIVEGIHGKGGGYKLKKDAKDITVLEVLMLTEGDLAPVSCLTNDDEQCEQCTKCKTIHMWNHFHDMILDYFSNITIADLVIRGKVELDIK